MFCLRGVLCAEEVGIMAQWIDQWVDRGCSDWCQL